MGLFLDSLFYFMRLWVFLPIPHLITLALYHILKSGTVSPPALLLFFKIILTILVPLLYHINFRGRLTISTKSLSEIFGWDCMESIHNLGKIDIVLSITI